MDQYLECTCAVTGQAELEDENVDAVIEKMEYEVKQAIADGYQNFFLALIGRASIDYANGILNAVEGHEHIRLDIMMPYAGWIDEQEDSKRYEKLLMRSSGFGVVSRTLEKKPIMITNNHVLDFASRMIVVSDGKDDEAESIISIAKAIDVPVSLIKAE